MNYQITPLSSLSNVLIIAWVAITGICYYALVAMDLKVVTSEFGVVENILYTEHGFIENLQVILLILLGCVPASGKISVVTIYILFATSLLAVLAMMVCSMLSLIVLMDLILTKKNK